MRIGDHVEVRDQRFTREGSSQLEILGIAQDNRVNDSHSYRSFKVQPVKDMVAQGLLDAARLRLNDGGTQSHPIQMLFAGYNAPPVTIIASCNRRRSRICARVLGRTAASVMNHPRLARACASKLAARAYRCPSQKNVSMPRYPAAGCQRRDLIPPRMVRGQLERRTSHGTCQSKPITREQPLPTLLRHASAPQSFLSPG